MANAGIDASNLGTFDDERERVLLLPCNPDATCAYLRVVMERHFACRIGILISDSVGRAWRNGTVGLALGVAGPPSIWNRVGEDDLTGRQLRATEVAIADQIAAAAALVMGEGAEGWPIVKAGGVLWQSSGSGTELLLRPKDQDLFR